MVVSEEIEDIVELPGGENSQYVICTDPVDGSSNCDINGSLGTIFGINTDGSDYSVLHSFIGGAADGSEPGGDLIFAVAFDKPKDKATPPVAKVVAVLWQHIFCGE